LYNKEGIDLHILQMKSALAVAGLKAEGLDYITPVGPSISAAAVGVPIKLIMVIGRSLPHSLYAKPPIKKVSDLKGKVIGVSGLTPGGEYYALREIVKHYGLNPDKDVTIIASGPDMGVQAMAAGSVDGAMTAAIASVKAGEKGYVRLARVSDILDILSIGLTATDKKIQENPADIKRMLRATLTAFNYIKTHKDEAIDIMVKDWGLERNGAIEVYESGVSAYSKDGTATDKAVMDQVDMAKSFGMTLRKDLNLSQLRDFTLLREVLKDLGL
ncbi:MAG: ABC transporter substrate-binding protein, partial [bacterium]|nr:ABC transporter substrate-binding protein [bacterium]